MKNLSNQRKIAALLHSRAQSLADKLQKHGSDLSLKANAAQQGGKSVILLSAPYLHRAEYGDLDSPQGGAITRLLSSLKARI